MGANGLLDRNTQETVVRQLGQLTPEEEKTNTRVCSQVITEWYGLDSTGASWEGDRYLPELLPEDAKLAYVCSGSLPMKFEDFRPFRFCLGRAYPFELRTPMASRKVSGQKAERHTWRISRWKLLEQDKVSLNSHWNCPLQLRLKSETRSVWWPQGWSYILIQKMCILNSYTFQAYWKPMRNMINTIPSLLEHSI